MEINGIGSVTGKLQLQSGRLYEAKHSVHNMDRRPGSPLHQIVHRGDDEQLVIQLGEGG